MLITILLAIIFLHETLVLKQVIGLCFAVATIFLLAGQQCARQDFSKKTAKKK
jgi:drug/metabolite transporter (DMT)-like permease